MWKSLPFRRLFILWGEYMDEKIEIIQKLSNEDLLALHSAILNHLKYLDEKVITEDEEEVKEEQADGGEENG